MSVQLFQCRQVFLVMACEISRARLATATRFCASRNNFPISVLRKVKAMLPIRLADPAPVVAFNMASDRRLGIQLVKFASKSNPHISPNLSFVAITRRYLLTACFDVGGASTDYTMITL
jgi:hypothetical protein